MVTSSGIGTLAGKEQPGDKKQPGDTSTALVRVHELLHAGNTQVFLNLGFLILILYSFIFSELHGVFLTKL